MNEKANTELVQKMYAAFSRGDIQTIMDSLAADVTWVAEGPDTIPFTGRRKGHAEVMAFFQALGSTQADNKLTIESIVAQGDTVASYGRYSGTVKATGKKFDSAVAHFFTIKNGKVTGFLDYQDTAQMADAYAMKSAAAR